jgi:hypothetical protein
MAIPNTLSDSNSLTESNLDRQQPRTLLFSQRSYAIPLGFNCRRLCNAGGIRLHPQQNRVWHAQQGVPFCCFVRTVCSDEFRCQLR